VKAISLLTAVVSSALCADAAFSAFCPDPALEAKLETNRVAYLYVEPTDAAHRPIYDRLKQHRVLESLSEFLSPLRLPRTLTLKVQGCDGHVNSYYWNDNVIVCYEYLDSLLKAAPVKAKSDELTRHNALIGMTVDVFLHETGHGVLDMLQIPFLGREEDVADEFGTYIELQLAKEDARRLILGVAFLGQEQSKEELAKKAQATEFADVHGTPAQRYFNVLCFAYGMDKDLFADAISRGHLPPTRAKNCNYEYARFAFGFQQLIKPYLDQNLVEQVKARKWFQFDTKH
jgi:Putative metallopeptidase